MELKGYLMFSEIEKALVATGASVAAGCQPCTDYHVKAARAAGACDRGLALVVEAALAVRASATRNMDEWAGQCQGTRPQLDTEFRERYRLATALTGVAAAFAVNSVPDLKVRLQEARQFGATPEQIRVAIAIAGSIKRIAEEKLSAVFSDQSPGAGCCCDAPAPPVGCGCGSGGD